jgi:hypothetical protein
MAGTARFRVIYVFVVLEIGTRRLIHWNVTAHPTDDWTIQQFRRSSPTRPPTGSSSTIEMGSTPGRRPGDRLDGTPGAGEILIGQRPKQLTPEPFTASEPSV